MAHKLTHHSTKPTVEMPPMIDCQFTADQLKAIRHALKLMEADQSVGQNMHSARLQAQVMVGAYLG